ncbi:putative uncharacterized protein DDB_G0271606 [Copidosoma floridanum]|uniref:putative uncharacterized protein DDB_G0271606 n=1 Tax=Copidosoma floridanum TaxID=29053 RepID=UPI0006C987E3|nr:putative uncharacterized protein DDB_G0271606 [Copidosoma floridanum]
MITTAVLLATLALAGAVHPLDLVEDLVASPSSQQESSPIAPPPVKLDKNLRRALLKALVDLEAESAEQHHQEQEDQQQSTTSGAEDKPTERPAVDEDRYDFFEISKQKSASFSFDSFPGDDEPPSEDKLQNSSFVESDRYETRKDEGPKSNSIHQDPPKDYTKGVQVHHVVSSEKASAIYETKPSLPAEHQFLESAESRNPVVPGSTTSSSTSTSSTSQIQKSVTFAPVAVVETLTASASGNVAAAAANALVAPRPSPSTKLDNEAGSNSNATNRARANSGTKIASNKQESAEEVRIFQAPLVAAFTVQQDERGVPRSVVPLYRAARNGTGHEQPLTLQEQLDFKQRLLEKQLLQLQAQQLQQTQFLIRQRQAYEEQLRQKQQQHEFYLQQQQQQQQRLLLQQQFGPPALPGFQAQPQLSFVQQLPHQQNPFLQQQPSFKATSVQLQPSLSLEVPSVVSAPPFQSSSQVLRGLQQLPPQPQQFQPFNVHQQLEFQQPPSLAAPVTRFNRQEAFNSVGNFGFNSLFPVNEDKTAFRNNNNNNNNKQQHFVQARPGVPQQQLPVQGHGFNFVPFRQQQQQQRPFGQTPTTPARQIQDLLFQSGIAGDLQGAGTRNHQEDINIVSKVLALNVGALPAAGLQRTKANGFAAQHLQFGVLKKK